MLNKYYIFVTIFAGLVFTTADDGILEGTITKTCDGAKLPFSYCLDCFSFAVCRSDGSHMTLKCSASAPCKESSLTTATCLADDLICKCDGDVYPNKAPDEYDEENKILVCLSADTVPSIQCTKGRPYNYETAECISPPPTTSPTTAPIPTVPCNKKLEFICLGCDFYQICLDDNTVQTYQCLGDTQCNEPLHECVDPAKPFECTTADVGFVGDPYDCTVYYYCDGTVRPPLMTLTCNDGEIFDKEYQGCIDDLTGKCVPPYNCSSYGSDTTTPQIKTTSLPVIATTTIPLVPCDCSPTIKTCAIDCRTYYYCYEESPGTYTLVKKTCPYDYNFNPSTEICEPAACVQ